MGKNRHLPTLRFWELLADLEVSKRIFHGFHGRGAFAPVLLRTVGIHWEEPGILAVYTWDMDAHFVVHVHAVAAAYQHRIRSKVKEGWAVPDF
jgi:hypothetical protein